MFNHSKECTVLLAEHWSLMAALATGSSRSLVWFPFQTLAKMLCLAPTNSTLLRAQTARTLGQSKTMSLLSKDLSPWSGLWDKVSSLSMDCPGQ